MAWAVGLAAAVAVFVSVAVAVAVTVAMTVAVAVAVGLNCFFFRHMSRDSVVSRRRDLLFVLPLATSAR